jgi:hypothetical protein
MKREREPLSLISLASVQRLLLGGVDELTLGAPFVSTELRIAHRNSDRHQERRPFGQAIGARLPLG